MRTIQELRGQRHWSYSSLSTLLTQCGLKWAFGHVYNVEPESIDASLPFGRAFHAAASHMARCRMKGGVPAIPDVQDAFSDHWGLELSAEPNVSIDGGDTVDSLNNLGRSMVKTLADSWPEGEQVVDVSSTFSVDVVDAHGNPASERMLIGELDMTVAASDGRIVIIDWKTAARKWSAGKASKHLQPTVLCYGVSQEMGSIPSFRFDVVTKTKAPAVERHPTTRNVDDFARLAELVKVADRIVEAEAYAPNEGSWECGSCQFANACANWHRNASRRTVPLAA